MAVWIMISLLFAVPVAAMGPAQPQPPQGLVFYVATDGDDAWSGRMPAPNSGKTDGPFATLGRARDAARALRAGTNVLSEPVTVLLRGGRYALTNSLDFGPEDSGTEGRPITYAAYGSERPIISGGAVIDGWHKHDQRLWVADLPWVRESGRPFHQLFVNGVRRPRARTPDEGAYTYTRRLKMNEARQPECVAMTYAEGDVGAMAEGDDPTIVLFHNWVNSYNRIGRIDRDARRITFARPAGIFFLGPRIRYYIEGVRAALDAPGEWYLDCAKGTLYYYPVAGEDMARAEVIAPCVGAPIVRIVGQVGPGPGVEHLVFRGLSFQHADADLSPGYPHSVQGAHTQRGALFAVGLRHSVIEGCEFARLGEHGVSLREGCVSNVVRQCHFHDMGGGGVYLSEGAPKSTNATYLTAHNRVENNFIHDGGLIFRAGCGVFLGGSASHNTIAHNEICDLSWMGVHMGWSWTGKAPAHTHHNEVAYNHIHHIGNGVLNDIGGIYTLGVSPGTVLHHNLIHDITRFERGREGYGGWGIYLDAGSSEIRVEDNIVYDTRDGGLHVHNYAYPYGDVVANNVFAYSGDAQLIRNASDEPDGNHVHLERNIVCNANAKMYGGNNWREGSKFTAEKNCYWSETNAAPDFAGKAFAEWQEQGRDREGIVADPGFVDPGRRDFRLRPDSPALKLGFRPIEMGGVGLEGPPLWRDLPRGIKHRVVERPPASAMDEGGPIVEDFEDYDMGERPAEALPKDGGTEVRVTDEAPVQGRRCAKFCDAAGATAWKPHWFVGREPGSGKVRLRFAVRNDAAQPATIDLEMRDWHGGSRSDGKYLTGPHVRFLPDGVVQSSGGPGWTTIAKCEPGQWVRVEVEFEEGEGKAKAYALRLTPDRGQMIARDGLPFRSPDFKLCTWCGFSGAEAKPGTFFVDDFRLE
ncbi:MAG TPA: right-handed parallel beta-helix repeat-containing protein [Verrucomicrobiae bacterium]|nr:right-handed parallel beta-helix repeat-containing protein [Verrucomicrobiae bacterium]